MRGGALSKVTVHNIAMDYMQVQNLLDIRNAAGRWSCGFCTVVNNDSASKCKTCGTARPAQVGVGNNASSPPVDENPIMATLRDMGFEVSEEDLAEAINSVGEDFDAVANYIMQKAFH